MTGHLILAGCGPYDEQLVSQQLVAAIMSADVILYDRLINKNLLKHAKFNAQSIYVGKDLNEFQNTQSTINEQIISFLKQGMTVVRLKSGDPFLFGRGFEEYQIAITNKFLVTVIPGLSSSLAVATSISLPLTLRDVSQGVTVLTGTNANNQTPEFSFTAKDHAYVFLMAVRNFEKIAKHMLRSNFAKDTQVIVISNGTYPNQQIVVGNLTNIVNRMEKYAQRNPAIIIVSPTIKQWQTFYRPHILSTKIFHQNIAQLDDQFQLQTYQLPLLKPSSRQLLESQTDMLNDAKNIVVSSPIALQFAKQLPIDWSTKQIITLGPKTNKDAKQIFANVKYFPEISTLAKYAKLYHEQNTVYLTSSSGQDIRQNENFVDHIIPIYDLLPTKTLIPLIPFDAITVYSPSAISQLVNKIEQENLPELYSVVLFCFGQVVYDFAKKTQFTNIIFIPTNDTSYFYKQISLYFKERYNR